MFSKIMDKGSLNPCCNGIYLIMEKENTFQYMMQS